MATGNRETLTIRLLRPNRAKRQWLEQMQRACDLALHAGLEAARQAGSRREMQRLAYRAAREQGLPGAYARVVADQVISGLRRADGQEADAAGFGLASGAYQVRESEGGWVLKISTGGPDRSLWFPLEVPGKFRDRRQWVAGDARLFQRKGKWYARFSIHRPPVALLRAEGEHTFIGIDLGVARLVTVAAPNRVWIVKGLALRYRRQQVDALCRQLARQGQHSLVGRLRARERRWMTAVDHQVSRRIIDLAGRYPTPVIVLERLAGLYRKDQATPRTKGLSDAWDFRQLVDFIDYKAQAAGIPVVFVDPRGTSNTCPKCGYNSAENAARPGLFRCVKCAYRANGDVVAARNIARRAANRDT